MCYLVDWDFNGMDEFENVLDYDTIKDNIFML